MAPKKPAAAPVRARRIPNAKPGEPTAADTKRDETSKAADVAKAKLVKASAKSKEEVAKAREVARIAKENERKAAREAKEKAAAAAAAKSEKVLAPLALDINARLEKIAMIEGKADDHRLSAAYNLELARKECEASGISFKKWAGDNIKQSYENVRKLVYIGGSPDPKLALEDMRNKNAAANKVLREKKKVAAKRVTSTPEKNIAVDPAENGRGKRADTAFQRVEAGFAEMAPEAAKEVVASQASQLGLQVLTDKEVKSLKSGGGASGVAGCNAIFDTLKGEDRFAVMEHITEKTGYQFVTLDDFKAVQKARNAAIAAAEKARKDKAAE